MRKTIMLIAILVILASCATPPEAQPAEQQVEPPAEDKFIVGAILPLTGVIAEPGEDFHQGMILAMEELDSDFVLEVQDSRSNPKDGLTGAQHLVATKDIDMFISLASAVSVPVAAFAEEQQIPTGVSLVVANDFTNSPYNFRHYVTAANDALAAKEFIESRGYEKIAIFHIENEYGQSAHDEFLKIFEGEVVSDESFAPGDVSYKTQLLKIKASGAEILYLLGYPLNNVQAFREKTELGIDIPVVGNSALVANSAIGKIETEEVYYGTNFLSSDSSLPEVKAFNEKFKERFNSEPGFAASFGYDWGYIIDAVQKSGKDVMTALHEVQVDSVNGPVSFDENGESNVENIMYQVENKVVTRVE